MHPPSRLYFRPIAIGVIGMFAGILTTKMFDLVFGKSSHSTSYVAFWIPWFLATIYGVNIGFSEGLKTAKKNKNEH